MLPVKLRSFEAKRYLIIKPISYYKLSEGTQLFSSLNCTKFYNIDSDKISEFLFGKYDIFTTRSERSTYLLARADNSDVMVTCFIKMAVFLFTKGIFYITNIKTDSTLSSEKKDNFQVFIYVKIKVFCPRAELPCRCLVHSVFFKYVLNCTLSKVGKMAIDVS